MPPDLEWSQLAGAFLDVHSRLNANASNTLEASSFVYSLVELLSEKGLISIDELDARQPAVTARLEKRMQREGPTVQFQDPEEDKYGFTGTVQIDCASRIHLCQAACCKLPFALSRQDIREGIVRWDLANPYVIAHGQDGYCEHIERGSCRCTIREHRPLPCRGYDCRKEKRIWLDFEAGLVNPRIYEAGWPFSEAPAKGAQDSMSSSAPQAAAALSANTPTPSAPTDPHD
jgi:Fe-S-cluster containining protein